MAEIIDIGTPLGVGVITTTSAAGIDTADLSVSNVKANIAVLSVATNVVRIQIDGTAATAGVGMVLPVGLYVIKGEDAIRKLSVIDTAAGAANVNYTTGRKVD